MPQGAWDTHFHVLGPQARFPYAATRKYTPPDADLQTCLRLHDLLGIDRGLVVHANTYGMDNRVDLDAVAGSAGRYLAVVRLDDRATPAGCRDLDRQGARGVRFAFNPQHGGTLDRAAVDHAIACVADLGWFVELHFDGQALPELAPWIAALPVPVVIDHFGRVDPGPDLGAAPVRALLALAERPNVWIKISGADRISRTGRPYDDVVPLAHRLVEVAADRLLWGSDFPHTGYFDPARLPDAGALLDALARFVPDSGMRTRILVDNPVRLLGGRTRPEGA